MSYIVELTKNLALAVGFPFSIPTFSCCSEYKNHKSVYKPRKWKQT